MRSALFFSILATSCFAAQVTTIADAQNPYGLVIGPDGALYICEIDGHRVSRLDLKTGQRSTVGTYNQPYEVRFDRERAMYVVDMPAHVVKKGDRVIAGTGVAGFAGDGGKATEAQFKQPHSIAFDHEGNLLICDIGNNRIRRVDLKNGTIDSYPGGTFEGPRAIAFDRDGNMFVVLRAGNAVYRINPRTHERSRFAGTGEKGYSGDGGPALNAKFNGPKGISCAPDGSIYVADTENHVIRRIGKDGVITTVLGTGERGDGPDGDPLKCRLSRPHGIYVAADGVVYVGDSESNKIRKLTSAP
jgi:DNA-binding beta-propeller fold protein YncE